MQKIKVEEMTKPQKEKAQQIADRLSEESLLAQCVEELAELSQVMAKRLRIMRGENYTPCSDAENYERLVEETADVILCLNVLNKKIDILRPKFEKIIEFKLNRWEKRLNDKMTL